MVQIWSRNPRFFQATNVWAEPAVAGAEEEGAHSGEVPEIAGGVPELAPDAGTPLLPELGILGGSVTKLVPHRVFRLIASGQVDF